MDYESFRNEYMYLLYQEYSAEETDKILSILDTISVKYDIQPKETNIILFSEIPKTVKLYITSKAIENKSRHTLDAYYRTLVNFFKTLKKPFDSVSSNDIRTYIFEYKEKRNVKTNTLDNIRRTVNNYYKWCVSEGYLDRNPAERISPIKSPIKKRKALSSMQLETIRSACKTAREKALIDFLYSTGCRVGELINVMLSDINLDTQTVVIQHGKGDKQRYTYLNAEAVVSLKAYLTEREDSSPYAFVSERKKKKMNLSCGGIQKIIKSIVSRTDLGANISPHIFRHTSATIAIKSGMPVEQVQKFLGHANINTTLIYTDIDDTDVKISHQKYIA